MGALFSKRRESRTMPANKGFQDNKIFKIISMKDKNVMDSQGGPVLVKKWNNAQSQKFKTVLVRSGEFRLYALIGEQSGQCLSFLPGSSGLLNTSWQDGEYQKWFAEEIYPNSNICIIKSSVDGHTCLQNAGSGQQVRVVQEDGQDPRQHWKLELTY